jgi:hypothetical protein
MAQSRAYRFPLACRQLGDNRTRCAIGSFVGPDPEPTLVGLKSRSAARMGCDIVSPLHRAPGRVAWQCIFVDENSSSR